MQRKQDIRVEGQRSETEPLLGGPPHRAVQTRNAGRNGRSARLKLSIQQKHIHQGHFYRQNKVRGFKTQCGRKL